jgi:hypothetical protein
MTAVVLLVLLLGRYTTNWSGVIALLFLCLTILPFLEPFTRLTRFATRKSTHFAFILFLMVLWIHQVPRHPAYSMIAYLTRWKFKE